MVIATGGVLNAGAHAEDIVLEEQGNVGGLVPGDLIYLLHQRCTLGLIGLNRCLIQQRNLTLPSFTISYFYRFV